ncbi:MAG: M20/M25/M40 family metallo-hydrolase [Chloroflexota bacterium]
MAAAVLCLSLGAAPLRADESAPSFSGPAAHAHVAALAGDPGARQAGSVSQAAATEYLARAFQSTGATVTTQPFPITYFETRLTQLAIQGPLGQLVATVPLTYSAAGSVEADLEFVGLAREGDFSPSDVAGKIALVQRGEIRFGEKVDRLASAGAAGAVIYNNLPGTFSGSLAASSRIPALSISREDGEMLLDQLRGARLRARLDVDASTAQRVATNVVATLSGGPRQVVVGAHYDAVAGSPGGNDNASGTAVLLELARIMAKERPPFTVTFVAFDAEEIGLLGSAHYVSTLSEAERSNVVAMINLDMVGVGTVSRFGGSDHLVRSAMAIAGELGQSSRPLGDGTLTGASDHSSFQRAGVPAVFIHRSEDPNYHGPNDRADLVDPENLHIAGEIALRLIRRLAGEL